MPITCPAPERHSIRHFTRGPQSTMLLLPLLVQTALAYAAPNVSDPIKLGTLSSNNTGQSAVRTLSATAHIAGGWVQSDSNTHRAALWHGSNWATKVDLGTFVYDD